VADTRTRILTATAELFRRQGYNATSVKQVTVAADAPFGSLYHHFPGGKQELAAEVLTTSGQAYQELFEVVWDEVHDPAEAVGAFFDGAAEVLVQTGYVDACPIGTVALEVASTDDVLREVTHQVFLRWQASAVQRFVGAGIDPDEAAALAVTVVAAIEGGFMLSRAARDPEPMRTAGRHVRRLVAGVLAEADAPA
jgi:AcrR family transcriptional regulator